MRIHEPAPAGVPGARGCGQRRPMNATSAQRHNRAPAARAHSRAPVEHLEEVAGVAGGGHAREAHDVREEDGHAAAGRLGLTRTGSAWLWIDSGRRGGVGDPNQNARPPRGPERDGTTALVPRAGPNTRIRAAGRAGARRADQFATTAAPFAETARKGGVHYGASHVSFGHRRYALTAGIARILGEEL